MTYYAHALAYGEQRANELDLLDLEAADYAAWFADQVDAEWPTVSTTHESEFERFKRTHTN